MKITKRQLKRIVKEEAARVRSYKAGTPESGLETAVEQIEAILNGLWDEGHSNSQLITILNQIITDIESGFVGEPT